MSKEKVKKKIHAYTEEFKQGAIQLALQSSSRLEVIAKELGIPKATLYTWVSNLKNGRTTFQLR